MTDAQKKAAEKIKSLLTKTEAAGCTAPEAAAAARVAHDMLVRYDLDLSDVERLQDAHEEVDHELFNPAEHGLEDAGERVAWTEMLARIIARAHGCEILVFDGHSHVLFIGRELNRKTVSYLFGFLCRTVRRLADEAYRAAVASYEDAHRRWDTAQQANAQLVPQRVDSIEALIRRIQFSQLGPEPKCPAERDFKASFLIAFVVAIEQRFNDRMAQSGALVLATKAAKEWIDKRTEEGDVRDNDTNQPELPRELDQRGTMQGFAHGASVSIDANAIEGQTGPEHAQITRGRTQIEAGTPPPAYKWDGIRGDQRPETAPPVTYGQTADPARPRLMRMRMTYFGPGVFFPQSQVVKTWRNPDGQTYRVSREDDEGYNAPFVTREYLEEFR